MTESYVLRMKKKNETVQIKQIAEKLNISPSTVSVVLSGKGDEMRISKATQEIVHKMAQEMNYHPNVYARRLRNTDANKSHFVIAIFMNIRTTGERIAGINEGLWAAEKNKKYVLDYILEFFEYDSLSECDSIISSSMYNGALVVGTSEKDIDYLNNKQLDLPVVVMNVPGEGFSSVYVDEYQVGRECAKLFQKAGISKAGIITQIYKGRGPGMRQLGFLQACKEYEIRVEQNWRIDTQERTFDCGRTAMKQLLDQQEIPQAVFIMSDKIAIGAVYTLNEESLSVPEDLNIICYGDNELLSIMKPTISCIRFSVKDMIEDAISLLIAMFESNIKEPVAKIRTADFVFRESFPDPDSH